MTTIKYHTCKSTGQVINVYIAGIRFSVQVAHFQQNL